MKTFSTRPSDVRREWRVIDASGQPLGRLSTQVATYLRGKHKPIYAPHLDVGDFVIVVNAAKIRLTGRKLEQKKYYHHSQHPGGLKVRQVKDELANRPERVIEHCVKGMLPKGSLGNHLFHHLKVYAGPEHPHAAQVNAKVAAFEPSPPGSNTPNAPEPRDTQDLTPAPAVVPQLPPEEQTTVLELPPAEVQPALPSGEGVEPSSKVIEPTVQEKAPEGMR